MDFAENKIGRYRHAAELFHVDFKGRLTLNVLGNHLLNCAGLHASERGFGMSVINEINYTWVLSRLVIEMERFPVENEKFTISTWVERVYRLFTDRNYAIKAEDGKVLGYARSVWAMINMNDRKPVDLESVYGEALTRYVCNNEPCPIAGPSRDRFKAKDEIGEGYVARYSDIDINGHVNSIKYIEHILDLFSLEVYDNYMVKRLEIAYSSEGHYGEKLHFFKSNIRENEYAIVVKNDNGEILCRSIVRFAKI